MAEKTYQAGDCSFVVRALPGSDRRLRPDNYVATVSGVLVEGFGEGLASVHVESVPARAVEFAP